MAEDRYFRKIRAHAFTPTAVVSWARGSNDAPVKLCREAGREHQHLGCVLQTRTNAWRSHRDAATVFPPRGREVPDQVRGRLDRVPESQQKRSPKTVEMFRCDEVASTA